MTTERNGLLIAWMLLGVIGTVTAQKLYTGPPLSTPLRIASVGDFDGSIILCRAQFESNRAEPEGSGWWTDYPGADHNFMVRLSELTEVRVRFDTDRIPFNVVIRLDDPLIHKCPVVLMSDMGTAYFTDAEVSNLISYFGKGGFMWADDSWGPDAWEQINEQMRRVLPTGQYSKWEDIKPEHPIFHQLYEIPGGIWQQPNIGYYQSNCDDDGVCSSGQTSERGELSAIPLLFGIKDAKDRLVFVASHNTDISDAFEEENDENREYFDRFASKSYGLGINIYLYALTH